MEDDKSGIYLDFGRRLKAARKNKKITQSRLADMVGLSRTSITNIECGRQQVSLHVFLALSKAVRVEPGELLPNIALISSNDEKLKDAVKRQGLGKTEQFAVLREIARLKGNRHE